MFFFSKSHYHSIVVKILPSFRSIPQNTRHTRKYPKEKKIPGNTRSYFSTLLPDPNPTRYPVFCPIPDPTRPDIEKPYPLGTDLYFTNARPIKGGMWITEEVVEGKSMLK